jgi:hypothetical protein
MKCDTYAALLEIMLDLGVRQALKQAFEATKPKL